MKAYAVLSVLLIAVQIQAVYYNPVDEANSEFILLHNPTSADILLDGLTIATPSSEQDATLQGSIAPNSTFLIADEGYQDQRDDPSWPQADYHETLTLPNTNGFVQLRNGTTVLDVVGWGDAEQYDTTPHAGVQESEILYRIQQSNNNAVDFEARTNIFDTQQPTQLRINISNQEPKLLSIFFDDENPQSQQLQVTPNAQTTYIPYEITVEDLNGVNTLNVSVNGYEHTLLSEGTQTTLRGNLSIHSSTQSIEIVISDEIHTEVIEIPVELGSFTQISIPQEIQLDIVPGKNSTLQVPITNNGTTDVDIHIRSDMPSWTTAAFANITYSIGGEIHELSTTYQAHELNLQPQETIYLDVHVHAGYVPAQEYIRDIYIVGVAS